MSESTLTRDDARQVVSLVGLRPFAVVNGPESEWVVFAGYGVGQANGLYVRLRAVVEDRAGVVVVSVQPGQAGAVLRARPGVVVEAVGLGPAGALLLPVLPEDVRASLEVTVQRAADREAGEDRG